MSEPKRGRGEETFWHRQSTAAGERESFGAEEKGRGEAGRDFQQGRHAGNRERSCHRPCPLLPGRLCDFVNQMNAALRLDFVQEAAE
ncbi:hypothetical protein U1Q18_025511 [Sarracenia purpurea var. burkii]